MRIAYRITAQDFEEAQAQHSGWGLRFMQVLGLILIAAGILNTFYDAYNLAMGLPPVVLGSFFVFGWRVLRTRAYKNNQKFQNEFSAMIDETGIDLSSGAARTESGWSFFTRFVETRNLFLLYQSPQCFNIFPKRAFDSPSADEFRSLASRAVRPAPKTGVKPGTWVLLGVVAVALVLLVMALRNIN